MAKAGKIVEKVPTDPKFIKWLRHYLLQKIMTAVVTAVVRSNSIRSEYKNIRRETVRKRRSEKNSHHEFKQHVSSIITKSIEIKEKHRKKKNNFLKREEQIKKQAHMNERAIQQRISATTHKWRFVDGPAGKSQLTRQINSLHTYGIHLQGQDHGEYLDHKHKWQMTAPDRQLWAHPHRKKPWRPAGGSPRPEDRLPFGALSPLSSFPDSDYEQRLRGIKTGRAEQNTYTHQQHEITRGENDNGGSSLLGEQEDELDTHHRFVSDKLSTSVMLDRMPEEDRQAVVKALADIRWRFELIGGRQYADMRAFDERDMSKSEFQEQLRKHLNIKFSRHIIRLLFELIDRDHSGYLSWLELLPKLYGNMDDTNMSKALEAWVPVLTRSQMLDDNKPKWVPPTVAYGSLINKRIRPLFVMTDAEYAEKIRARGLGRVATLLTIEERVRRMDQPTRHRLGAMIKKLRARFLELGGAQNADLHGFDDGRDMSERELRNQLRRQFNLQFSTSQIKLLVNFIDRDQNGTISFLELLPHLFANRGK
jgi:Ca2+-binding EF-hand superfamily protein